MTRKDFTAIAQSIRNSTSDKTQRQIIAHALLPALRASNPNFDESKFIEAAVG